MKEKRVNVNSFLRLNYFSDLVIEVSLFRRTLHSP